MDFTLHYSGTITDDNYTYNYASEDESSTALSDLTELCKDFANDQSLNPVAIVFYSTEPDISDFLAGDCEATKGFSIYEMSGNTLTHRLFIDNGSDFIESSANNRTVNIIWIDHIRTILLHEIRDVHPSVNAYHLFTSNSYENNSNNITSRNELSMHQAYYLNLQNELSSSYQIPISGLPRAIMIDCPPDCQGGNNGCASQNRQLSCAGPTPPDPEDEPICSESASSSYAVSNSILTQVQADQLFNKPLHYDLRDDLLSTSNFGRKYINYYYSVSIYLSISDYSTYIYDIISLLDDINSACTKILNPATYGNDILITETFADELVELFNNLKSTTTNSDLTSIMNDIISDVEEIEGLTVNQVLTGYF